ncbi:MAG: tRNA (adenosine(37)-N6)-threonylcarbamoyltransferase complex dimerization subunit type 1 TsaB [Gemmatimonadetes bacterium]|nr:tRNA (adenosine(37)-N6)-threonylcarbamoyltransferase complex dimerization subunit type 1 TsaB [Gemmatimonadota bacterium]MBP9200752.1 tRNA (adenosine(37)-N6)-threonylcarbamoyltransferase complex dimerization subunit type 1 TsaB [Gemmatimonadales bacterium]MBK6779523.1 tRNA (adenosine(37)-N6)-threonylcarbamoyltransferase complex dimerization subunit type 1 TsaB [Gemmatimonadota bacterium]MBK7716236.1 tRNA (adenosine(37)-N6)-threonylcarbamoyltransferase complex dimerization subunit type 1 TsaB 
MWLAIDTATDRASIALGGPGLVAARAEVVGARRHAAELLPAIERCLAEAGLGYGALEGIVLADGPGSFTGLRVGAAVAKALVRARRMPLWVTPSLLVCAAARGTVDGVVLAVSNALRGDLFAAAYRVSPSGVETILAPAVLRPDAIHALVPAPVAIVGPAASTLGSPPTWPEAAMLLDLVGRAGGVRQVAAVAAWEPEYGRPAEAQVQWELKHGRPLADPARAGR